MVSFIQIKEETVKGIFKERLTRFSALVEVKGETSQCFLPNPGRLSELLTPDATVILKEAKNRERKTQCDLIGVYYKGQQVSVDSRVPNKLVLEALKNKDLPEFSEYSTIVPEYLYGHTRFDFFLSDARKPCFLEVKSCTLVKDGVALFPDAKTERGTRHVQELLKAKNEGYRACILFLVQRTDTHVFSPDDEADPKFGRALRDAASHGVEVYAYCSDFTGNRITLKGKIKIKL